MRVALCLLILTMACLTRPDSVMAQEWAGVASQGQDLAVDEIQWGFDGCANEEGFTLLSLLLRNPSNQPAAVTLRVCDSLTGQISYGTNQIELPVEIPPREQRWVQLGIPYSLLSFQLILQWNDSPSGQIALPIVRTSDRAVILLVNQNHRVSSGNNFKRFPAELFPASPALTDHLGVVILDAQPQLQGARLKNFLNWIQTGGVVVLLPQADGSPIRFKGELEVLNAPLNKWTIGSGVVIRSAVPLEKLDQKQFAHLLKTVAGKLTNPNRGGQDWQIPILGENRGHIRELLNGFTRINQRWWLIYPLAIAYLGLMFPVGYRIANASPRISRFYLHYLGTVVLFSILFVWLGTPSGKDGGRICSVAVARMQSPGMFDVTQWTNMLSLRGQSLSLRCPGESVYLQAFHVLGEAGAIVRQGADAQVDIDIPTASSRNVMARFTGKGADEFTVTPLRLDLQEGQLVQGSLQITGLTGTISHVMVATGDHLKFLQKDGDSGVWKLQPQGKRGLSEYIQYGHSSLYRQSIQRTRGVKIPGQDPYAGQDKLIRLADQLQPLFVTEVFSSHVLGKNQISRVPAGLMRVLVTTLGDQEFAPIVEGISRHEGVVMYVTDLPISGRGVEAVEVGP